MKNRAGEGMKWQTLGGREKYKPQRNGRMNSVMQVGKRGTGDRTIMQSQSGSHLWKTNVAKGTQGRWRARVGWKGERLATTGQEARGEVPEWE